MKTQGQGFLEEMLLCCHSEHAPLCSFQHFHVPDTTTFSICPGGEHSAMKSSSLPCWDFMPDMGPSLDTALLQKQIVLGFSPAAGADSSQCWSLPAVVRRDFPRQSIAVPCGTLRENGFWTRYFPQVSMLFACRCCRSSRDQGSSVSICNSRFSFIFNDFRHWIPLNKGHAHKQVVRICCRGDWETVR